MWPAKPRFNLKRRLVAIKRRRKVEAFLIHSQQIYQQPDRSLGAERRFEDRSSGDKFNCGELG
jgi:hypothetical protein